MKIPIAILSLLGAVALAAAPVEKPVAPAFPKAVISIAGPSGKLSSHRLEDMVDLVRSAAPGFTDIDVSAFSGSESLSVDGKSYGEISWRHVTGTEFGDIYLVFGTLPDGKKEAASLLFDGKSDLSWRCGDWLITISIEKPKPSKPTAPSDRGSS